MIMTDSILENDVLFGRGGATNNHEGNRRFRAFVADHQAEYLEARKKDKARISRRIVHLVRERGGRFLRRDDETGLWVEVGDKKAIEKTSQALREGLDVRAHHPGGNKAPRRDSEGSGSTYDSAPKKKRKVSAEQMREPESPSLGSATGEQRSLPDLEEEIPRMMPSFIFQHPAESGSFENVVEV
jgi:hypothetical protein